MILLASISGSITDWIAQNGVYAVFALMAVDALRPAGGELIMLYAGVLASGSISGHGASLFGLSLASGTESYVALAAAGTVGYLAGAMVGWAVGRWGGRTLVERHGRWFHLSPEAFGRAEGWFGRHGQRTVLLGRITPVVRSFISIPAGVFRTPLPAYLALTLIGSAIWCFGFAVAGWALGGSWQSFHESFRNADYTVALAFILLAAFLVARRLRSQGRPGPIRLAAEEPSD
ncbi:MAG: DedA family protein [Solirubrobacterales bacterium]